MAKLGSITLDEVEILEVDQDPSISGVDAPLSSIALLNDKNSGACWLKTGSTSTSWTSFTGSGTSIKNNYSTTSIVYSTLNSYVNVAQLTTNNLSVGLYKFHFIGMAQSNSAENGIGIRISDSTATVSTMYARWLMTQNNNGTSPLFQYDQTSNTTNVTSLFSPEANSNFIITGEGTFRIDEAGSVAIQLRSENSGVTVSLQPDALLIIESI